MFLSPFSIAITSLGEERAIIVFFVRLFDLRLFGFVVASSSWCLGRAVACGTPWTFLLPFCRLLHVNIRKYITQLRPLVIVNFVSSLCGGSGLMEFDHHFA